MNDLPGAHIHATRLYNILDSLQKGHPPTIYALSYLQKQGLVALSLFAQAKMTYEAFRDAAAVEQAERKPALEAELLARRTAERAREAAWEAECERERRKAEEAQLRYESECRHHDTSITYRHRQRQHFLMLSSYNPICFFLLPACPLLPLVCHYITGAV